MSKKRTYGSLAGTAEHVDLAKGRRRLDGHNPVVYHPSWGALSGWRSRWAPQGDNKVPAWSISVVGRSDIPLENGRMIVGLEDLADVTNPMPVVFVTDANPNGFIVDPPKQA